MRIRYRLRTLLLAFVLVALFFGWGLKPTFVANTLVNHVGDRNWDSLGDLRHPEGGGLLEQYERESIRSARAQTLPLEWRDLALGRRRMQLQVWFHQPHDIYGIRETLEASGRGITIIEHDELTSAPSELRIKLSPDIRSAEIGPVSSIMRT